MDWNRAGAGVTIVGLGFVVSGVGAHQWVGLVIMLIGALIGFAQPKLWRKPKRVTLGDVLRQLRDRGQELADASISSDLAAFDQHQQHGVWRREVLGLLSQAKLGAYSEFDAAHQRQPRPPAVGDKFSPLHADNVWQINAELTVLDQIIASESFLERFFYVSGPPRGAMPT